MWFAKSKIKIGRYITGLITATLFTLLPAFTQAQSEAQAQAQAQSEAFNISDICDKSIG